MQTGFDGLAASSGVGWDFYDQAFTAQRRSTKHSTRPCRKIITFACAIPRQALRPKPPHTWQLQAWCPCMPQNSVHSTLVLDFRARAPRNLRGSKELGIHLQAELLRLQVRRLADAALYCGSACAGGLASSEHGSGGPCKRVDARERERNSKPYIP